MADYRPNLQQIILQPSMLLENEHRRRGLSPDEARLAALRAMGSVALVHDAARDAGSLRWADDMMHDSRHAVRGLRQAPGFAAAAILTLDMGPGVRPFQLARACMS